VNVPTHDRLAGGVLRDQPSPSKITYDLEVELSLSLQFWEIARQKLAEIYRSEIVATNVVTLCPLVRALHQDRVADRWIDWVWPWSPEGYRDRPRVDQGQSIEVLNP